MVNKHPGIVVLLAILSVAIMWLPFLTKANSIWGIDFKGAGMERIVQNFDGLNFLIVAKTWYNPAQIQADYADITGGRRPLYFSAHYPGFPVLIAAFDPFLSGPNALMLAIMVSNGLLAIALYAFFLLFTNKPKTASWLAVIALFFPARMLSNRIVGSNEALFIFLVLSSLIFSSKKQHWLSALTGSLAVITRSPGIILFGAYMIVIWLMSAGSIGQKIKQSIPYLLIPLSLLALFGFYGYRFGSFWAYFQVGGNINLYWPYAVFASSMDWVSGIWNEDLIYLLVLLSTGLSAFWQRNKKSAVAVFGLLYGIFVVLVAHRDLARYSLPIIPIALVGIAPLLEHKVVKVAMAIVTIPIFLYAWQFVLANYQPVMDWTHLL